MTGCKGLLALCVTLSAGCGGGGSSGMVAGPPPPASTPTITTQRVFGTLSFNQPVALLQAPGDSTRWFVAEKGGFIRVFANDQGTLSASTFLDISSLVNSAGEGGLLGLAFHPNFPSTPEVFVSYTRSGAPLVSYISRFRSVDNGLTLNAAGQEVVLTVNQPATNHNGGDLAFGPDNFLYAGFGDGGGANDQYGNGQNTNTLMGTVVRIDVDGGSPYAIPAGNPFEANMTCTGGAGIAPCPEIYAWGLRNPWRFSFDGGSGKLWVGDVGQGSWEEIDVITAGGNYGWDAREGAHCFNPTSGCATNFIEPISEYGRGLGNSITGGYVYRGSLIADLGGWYLFGDFGSGRLFGVPENSSPGTAPVIFDETGLQIVSFGQSIGRELYVLHFGGTIHQIVDAP